jgi:hypothetical protein
MTMASFGGTVIVTINADIATKALYDIRAIASEKGNLLERMAKIEALAQAALSHAKLAKDGPEDDQ